MNNNVSLELILNDYYETSENLAFSRLALPDQFWYLV